MRKIKCCNKGQILHIQNFIHMYAFYIYTYIQYIHTYMYTHTCVCMYIDTCTNISNKTSSFPLKKDKQNIKKIRRKT